MKLMQRRAALRPLIQASKPSIEGPKYARVQVDGQWFTIPVVVLAALERNGEA